MNSIILMGCGKSTQARLLSKHFNASFFDTDDIITRQTEKTPREIYTLYGKEAFLKAETNACLFLQEQLKLQSPSGKNSVKAVAATGGGICTNPKAIQILKETGILIFLNSDESTALNRILRESSRDSSGNFQNLPAYIAKENPKNVQDVISIFHNFYEERQKLYEEICSLKIDLQPLSKEENSKLIIKKLEQSGLLAE